MVLVLLRSLLPAVCRWLAGRAGGGVPARAASSEGADQRERGSRQMLLLAMDQEEDEELYDADQASGPGGSLAGAAAEAAGAAPGLRGLDAAVSRKLRAEARGQTTIPSTAAHAASASAVFALLTRADTVAFLGGTMRSGTAGSAAGRLDLCIAEVFGELLARTGHRDPDQQHILKALARGQGADFLRRVWSAMRPGLVGQTCCPVRLEHALLSFGAVYSFLLMSLDDTEVFEQSLPFDSALQLEIVVVVRTLLYDLFWGSQRPDVTAQAAAAIGASSSASDPAEARATLVRVQLQSCLARLYNQLYDRHARRDFAHIPREQWLWPDAPSVEVSDASRPGPRDGSGAGGRKIGMVLTCIPQVIPFKDRILRFHQLIEEDQQQHGNFLDFGGPSINLTVRRDTVYEDAMKALNPLGPNLKGRIRVVFESDLGYQEAGIDGGGLFRDFMDALCERAFDPSHGMFNVTPDQVRPSAAREERGCVGEGGGGRRCR